MKSALIAKKVRISATELECDVCVMEGDDFVSKLFHSAIKNSFNNSTVSI